MSIINPTVGPDQYTFYVSVSPSTGVDECNADYTLECRMDHVNLW